jgi:hypothetical protein
MAGVDRLGVRIAGELHAERDVQGNTDSLPRVQRQAAAHASLQAADGHSTETDPLPQLRLRQAATAAGVLREAALTSELLLVSASRLN